MSVLIFGRTGQVARELQRLRPDATYLGRAEANLRDPAACAARVIEAMPTAVILAAAWTAVDAAEDHEAEATVINGETPGAIAAACAELGVPLVHISTDYVFSGQGDTAQGVDTPTGPLGAYGRSKLAGEVAVRAAGGPHAILRTSWVFSAHGLNFVKTMLRLSAERAELSVVSDQVGGPTPASALARACLTVADALVRDPGLTGTYNFAGKPDVSWADFARAILTVAGRDTTVQDIATSGYPTRALRPQNSRLDCRLTESVFGLARPDWQAALREVVAELEPA